MLQYRDIELYVTPEIYSPAEDTDLMIHAIDDWFESLQTNYQENKTIRILDLGCGPGTLGLYVMKTAEKKNHNQVREFLIYAVDINPECIRICKKNAEINKYKNDFKFYIGDLTKPLISKDFEEIQVKFDLILFNPPYLPGDEDIINKSNRTLEDKIWEGGLKGDELIIRFLKSVDIFLKNNTELIFISSSQVDQTDILNEIKNQNFKIIKKNKLHIFFEDILCYTLKK